MSEANGEFPEIKRIGVVGAGQMGCGIAHVFALAGFDVHLVDISDEHLEQARGRIASNLDRQIAHGRITSDEKTAALAHITMGTELEAFADSDLVIEVGFADPTAKRALIGRIEAIISPGAVLASPVSAAPLLALAEDVSRPEELVGLGIRGEQRVELTGSPQTAPGALMTAASFCRRIGVDVAVVDAAVDAAE